MQKEKFLIIGSNSFSGASFINYLLDKEYSVLGVSRSSENEYLFLPYKWDERIYFNPKKNINRFKFKKLIL